MAESGERFERTLFDFEGGEAIRCFRPINDGVMGGVSTGVMASREGEGSTFRGVVSLENNGGFASVRSAPGVYNLEGYEGMTLRVMGDGKSYKLLLKTSAEFDGVQYQARFQSPRGTWETLTIPFSSFVPVSRGRLLNNADPLDPAKILTVGLMISDRQEGPFSLTISRIGAYR